MNARTAAAIVAIVLTAVATIAATALLVAPGGRDGDALPVLETPALPRLGPMLPTLADVEALTPWPMEVRIEDDALGPPPGPDFATQPAGCSSLSTASEATTYGNVNWLSARRVRYMPTPASVVQQLQVNASIVLTPSDGVALTFIKENTNKWKGCQGETFHFGTAMPAGFRVQEVTATTNSLFSISVQANAPHFTCRHAVVAKGPYIVEGHSCGAPPIDVQRWTDAILAQVPD